LLLASLARRRACSLAQKKREMRQIPALAEGGDQFIHGDVAGGPARVYELQQGAAHR